MAKTVAWTDNAREDLREIFLYINISSPYYAETVVKTIGDKVETLDELSERGRIVPELEVHTIRELFVYQYRVLYQVEEARVVILGIAHMSRDFSTYWKSIQN